MKKISLIFVSMLILISVLGCSKNTEENIKMIDGIKIEEIDWNDIDWVETVLDGNPERIEFREKIEPILTNEEAIAVGKALLEVHFPNHYLVYIRHSIRDNIWALCYSLNGPDTPPEEYYFGGGYVVVFSGNDGKIVKYWLEE